MNYQVAERHGSELMFIINIKAYLEGLPIEEFQLAEYETVKLLTD